MAILVLVTIPQDKAKFLAELLLNNKLCACVNILNGVQSFFWWDGKIDQENESLLLIKTKSSLFSELEKLIISNHPYTVPEIIALKIDKINKKYLDWLNKEACG